MSEMLWLQRHPFCWLLFNGSHCSVAVRKSRIHSVPVKKQRNPNFDAQTSPSGNMGLCESNVSVYDPLKMLSSGSVAFKSATQRMAVETTYNVSMVTMLPRQRNVKCKIASRAQETHSEEGTIAECSVTATSAHAALLHCVAARKYKNYCLVLRR
jgi:hypothetical protein